MNHQPPVGRESATLHDHYTAAELAHQERRRRRIADVCEGIQIGIEIERERVASAAAAAEREVAP